MQYTSSKENIIIKSIKDNSITNSYQIWEQFPELNSITAYKEQFFLYENKIDLANSLIFKLMIKQEFTELIPDLVNLIIDYL